MPVRRPSTCPAQSRTQRSEGSGRLETSARKAPLRLAIAGLGAIGLPIARRVDAGDVPGLELVAVSVRDEAKARNSMASFRAPPTLMGLSALAEAADVIVECLPSKYFLEVAEPAIARGRIFLPLSVGALIDHMQLVELARKTGARIIVPTGALLGLDAVRAAAICFLAISGRAIDVPSRYCPSYTVLARNIGNT